MSRAIVWQRALIAFCAFGLAQLCVSLAWAHALDAYRGADDSPAGPPFVDRIDRVVPGGPADRAGLRAGDLVETRAMSAADRHRWRNWIFIGKPIAVPVLRDGRLRLIALVSTQNVWADAFWRENGWNFYVRFAADAFFLVAAILLIARSPDDPDVRLLSLLLALVAVGNDFEVSSAWTTPWAFLDMAGNAISPFLECSGLALLAVYALRFAKPVSILRRILTVAAFATSAFAALAASAATVLAWLGIVDDASGIFSGPVFSFVSDVFPFSLPLACALLAVRDARGDERSRIAWATGSLAILYVEPIVSHFVTWPVIGHVFVANMVHNVAYFVAAAGLAYSLLDRRLLDVGFALNRAAVFAAVSFVVVAAFSLAEWALGGWLQSASRNTNVLVSGALALALGLSIHPIHTMVDRFVDNVFFRARHEAEKALRTFAKEAAFISDAPTILERATNLIERSTGCAWVEFALFDGRSKFGAVDENDPAIVALRAQESVVDLARYESALRGEFAFPMSSRGRVIGALAIGPKRLGESYAPDERDALSELAHGLGVALDVLTIHGEALERRDAIVASQAALVAAIERLPGAIVERLRDERATR